MERLYVPTILTVFMVSNFCSFGLKQLPTPDQYRANLHYIGTIEGKSFFADMTKRNWTESKRYCELAGLKITSITSVTQRIFLSNAYNDDTFVWWFWTGGRDAQTLNQLVWDTDKLPLNSSVVSHYRLYNGIQTCLALFITSHKDGLFDFENCSLKTGVICELVIDN